MMGRAQVSIELMVLIGAILVIFIPLLLHVYFKTNEANEQLFQVQAELASGRLANLINAAGNLGSGSSLISEVFIPSNIRRIELKNVGRGGELAVRVRTQSGETEIIDIVRFPVTPLALDNPLHGLRRFNISYDGSRVNVRVV